MVDSAVTSDLMEMLANVLLPFAAYAAAIILVTLIILILFSAFWRMIIGSSE
jgi:hypothetical protein